MIPCGQAPLEIRFRKRKLQRICNSRKALRQTFGVMADVIENRLLVLDAANHLGLVPTARPIRRHQLLGKRRCQFAVDLDHPFRLVFQPDHDPIPMAPDGGIDINAVTAIEIIEIVDYH